MPATSARDARDAGRVDPPFPFAAVSSVFYYYWTSSTSLASPGTHFALYLSSVANSPVPDGNGDGIVHCVRGAPLASSLGTSGGSVHDSGTGLTWQSTVPGSQMAWQTALAYCDGLELDGATDWRLPSIKELLSLVDGRFSPLLSRSIRPRRTTSTSVPAARARLRSPSASRCAACTEISASGPGAARAPGLS